MPLIYVLTCHVQNAESPSKRLSTGPRPRSYYPAAARPISYTGQRPLSYRPASTIVLPPSNVKEPAILATWGAKSRPTSYSSQTMHDSVTSKQQIGRSGLSLMSLPSEGEQIVAPERKPLTKEDLQSLFSGAPRFEILADDNTRSAVRITMCGTLPPGVERTSDCEDFVHPAFADSSAHGVFSAPVESATLEKPNMARLAGRALGTVGLEYFLQLAERDGCHAVGNVQERLEKRKQLLETPETFGLRSLDIGAIFARLSELSISRKPCGGEQQETTATEEKILSMHEDLFAKLLTTPKLSEEASEGEIASLEVQIAALTNVLDASDVWFDYNDVDQRTKIGQLLWSGAETQGNNDDAAIPKDRDVLLQQIALSCELLTRLEMSDSPAQGRSFSRKIQWDLVLARRFLENIKIMTKSSDGSEVKRNSTFSALSFVTANESVENLSLYPVVCPRDEGRQLEGLLKFAELLDWPHATDIDQHFVAIRKQSNSLVVPGSTQTLTPAIAAYAKPVTIPEVPVATSEVHRPGKSTIAQSVQLLPAFASRVESPDAGGWLSRSWLAGMVLPGEAASQFLMGTLLEHSPKAIEMLGDEANLNGGFVYRGRSYWSKNCIVGRVLAAEEGARDCMGWISVPSVPAMHADEWVDVDVQNPVQIAKGEDAIASTKNSDFVRGEGVEKEGGFFADKEFTYPADSPPVLGNEACYQGLTMRRAATSSRNSSMVSATSTPNNGSQTNLSQMPLSTASLTFTSKGSSHTKTVLPLSHDVYFISANPCFPTGTPPASADNGSMISTADTIDQELPKTPCHPLHNDYPIEVVPTAMLLSCGLESYDRNQCVGTLVLDCRGSHELELMARAWCASVGEHAIVGKAGTTCLSCCVREACAATVKVVIRT